MHITNVTVNLLVSLVFVFTLQFASAQSNMCTPQNQPQGVNNTLLVTPASQDIDDKSPMASSTSNTGPTPGYIKNVLKPETFDARVRSLLKQLHSDLTSNLLMQPAFNIPQAESLAREATAASLQQLIDSEHPADGLLELLNPNSIIKIFGTKFVLGALPPGADAGQFTVVTLSNAEEQILALSYRDAHAPPSSDDKLRRADLDNIQRYVRLRATIRQTIALFKTKATYTGGDNPLDLSTHDYEDLQQMIHDIVGKSLYVGIQLRANDQSTQYLPEAIYSNGDYGFDVAAQSILSPYTGEGVSGRLNLTASRLKLKSSILKLRSSINAVKRNPDPYSVLLLIAQFVTRNLPDDIRIAQNDAVTALTYYILVPHISANIGYRNIENLGSIFTEGVSASIVRPIERNSEYDGITFLVSAQYLELRPEREEHTFTSRFGGAVYWQDRISRKAYVGADGHTNEAEIRRWETQSGFEFVLHNRVQRVDSYDVFVRQRIEPFSEITLSLGRDGTGLGFLMLSLGHTFSL